MRRIAVSVVRIVATTWGLCACGDEVRIDAATGFNRPAYVRCVGKVANGALALDEIGRDSHVDFAGLEFDSANYGTLVYRYRATGTGASGGQLYYSRGRLSAWSDKRRWNLPAPVADGQWHTETLDLGAVVSKQDWQDGGFVRAIRLDPTDAAGGRYELAFVKFVGTAADADVAKVAAGLFDEPAWPAVHRVWRTEEGVPEVPVVGPYFGGRMITSPTDLGDGKPHAFTLKRTFTAKGAVRTARLQAFVDGAGEIRLNGKAVWKGRNQIEAYQPLGDYMTSEVVTEQVRKGSNVLEIEMTTSARHRGGAIAELFVAYEDGTFERIDTDGKFGDVICMNPPPAAPWPIRLPYVDYARPVCCRSCEAAPAKAVAGDEILINAEFEGPRPEGEFEVKVRLQKGASLWWEENVRLSAASNVADAGSGCWALRVPFVTPLYFREGEFTVGLETGAFYVRGGKPPRGTLTLCRASSMDRFSKSVVCEVKKVGNGAAQIFVDGRSLPVAWGGVERQRRPDGKPNHGFDANLVTVMVDSRTWNPAPGVYDFALLDRAAEAYRRENPNAYFLWDLMVCPPRGWDLQHPDEMCRGENGEISRDGNRLNWSFASRPALETVREAMAKAVEWVESSPYANRVIGYRVNSGHTTEWLGWEPVRRRPGDFSAPMEKAFAAFARKHYPELRDPHPPTWAEQTGLDNGGDLLWDPQRHLNAIAFTRFLSRTIAADIISLATTVKKMTGGRKIVCTYYGYTSTLNANGCSQLRGHFALKDFLKAGEGIVDMVISPQCYGLRNFGDTCGDMKPFATLAAHGVVAGIENDTRTYRSTWRQALGYCQAPTPWHSVQILRRDFAIALCRDQPIYYYSLCSGTDFPPEMAESVALLNRVDAFRRSHGARKRPAEVAVVTSERAIWNSPVLTKPVSLGGRMQMFAADGDGAVAYERKGTVLTSDIFEKNLSLYHRSGVPVDYLLAEDLKDNPGDYRLYVFENCFAWDDAFREAVEGLRARGATLLWLYAPGYEHELRNSTDNMKALTGMTFGLEPADAVAAVKMSDGRTMGLPDVKAAPLFHVRDADEALGKYASGAVGVAVKRTGKSTSVFSGPWQPDVRFVREVLRRAQVHVWCESGDPVEAAGDLFTLHARFPGVKTVHLPRKATVVDVYNRRVVARDVKDFSFTATLHSSHLFYFGDDADRFLEGLK